MNLVLVSLVLSGLLQTGEKPPETEQRVHNLDRVSAPRDAEIRTIRDAKDWTNPFIVVCPEGYELILHGVPRNEKRLTAKDLEATLSSLPVSRWPLGKVIAAQNTGLKSIGTDVPIRENRKALEVMLKRLRVRVDWWPSA